MVENDKSCSEASFEDSNNETVLSDGEISLSSKEEENIQQNSNDELSDGEILEDQPSTSRSCLVNYY